MFVDALLQIAAGAFKVRGQQALALQLVQLGSCLPHQLCTPPCPGPHAFNLAPCCRRTREPCTAGCCVNTCGCAPAPAGSQTKAPISKRRHAAQQHDAALRR